MLSPMNFIRPRPLILATLLVSSLWPAAAKAEESQDTFVIGTGLVVGLSGTGDSHVDGRFVDKSIVGVLKKAGLEAWRDEIVPGHIAKVIVTAELPPEPGMPLKITLIPAGDATSLAGGTLLATPLRYTTGKIHAVAQGQIGVDGQIASVDGQQQAGERELVAAD